MSQAVTILEELQMLIMLPFTVQRFHAMVQDHSSDVLPMMLQLGMRTKEAQAALVLRGEKMGRSGLAVAVQQTIAEPSETLDS